MLGVPLVLQGRTWEVSAQGPWYLALRCLAFYVTLRYSWILQRETLGWCYVGSWAAPLQSQRKGQAKGQSLSPG